ncbi:hypothetical protein AQ490_14580 [Wenjunlia vitaminophila]|uniref:Uncharacterized protein n=1 Tax=Wenjunlia vitaminophila TaxID=76728 RepID=A0A0T6LWE2_WENVI|nr:hypothetical protein [Wenjunlia vitaminophila]KRV50328.1 hypothetical protein AQ490_14580 [Wenjunlia vitaminophila]
MTMGKSGRAGRGSRPHSAGTFGVTASGTRHPLVAAAMVVPLAALLAVVFGGWDQVVMQASSVAGTMGR